MDPQAIIIKMKSIKSLVIVALVYLTTGKHADFRSTENHTNELKPKFGDYSFGYIDQ